MSKQLLIKHVAGSLGVSQAEAERAVNAVAGGIADVVNNGETIRLAPLGTFARKHRAGRTGRNPQTGETIQIAARDVIAFKPAKAA